jgi:hypothetical protein
MDDFKKAVSWCADWEDQIGLIGGEPLLHPDIKKFMTILNNLKRTQMIMLFTNGIYLDKVFEELKYPKVRALINMNSPETIGEKAWARLNDNIEYIWNNVLDFERFGFGLNLYQEDQEFDWFIKFLKKYHRKQCRFAVIVPFEADMKNKSPFPWFEQMKPTVKRFFKACLENEITPGYDCNKIPSCIMTRDDWPDFLPESFFTNGEPNDKIENLYRLLSPQCDNCGTVMDIYPDLTVSRCFGMLGPSKVNMADFESAMDLRNYYQNRIDNHAFSIAMDPKCKDCYQKKIKACQGGCLAYKADKILKLNEYAESL